MSLVPSRSRQVWCIRTFEWDAMHRLPDHPSKCCSVHGHRYKATVSISIPTLDGTGMVVDFGTIKSSLGAWIETNWDHNSLLWHQEQPDLIDLVTRLHMAGNRPAPYIFAAPPTAETIAVELARIAQKLMSDLNPELVVEVVEVLETPNCAARWIAD